MKTGTSPGIMLIVGLSALLAGPALAAFGDNVAPANSLNGNGAAGSALPPGTYPSSPSDSNKKAEAAPRDKASTDKSSPRQPDRKKPAQKAPRDAST